MLTTTKPFYDLSICVEGMNDIKLHETCEHLIGLGYRTVALNHVVEMPETELTKKRKKGEVQDKKQIIPEPVNHEKLVKDFEGKLQFHRRVTFQYSDHLQAYKALQSPNMKLYDIIAAQPTTTPSFQQAVQNLDVDIITLDPNNHQIIMNRKTYMLAVQRGIYFELMYSPTLTSSTFRKNVIQMSHIYHSIGKSKNIIVTSWGKHPMDFRGPYDIINLGLIFGLSEQKAKDAISNNCRMLLILASGRRYGKSVVIVTKDDEFMEKQDSSESDDASSDPKKLCVG